MIVPFNGETEVDILYNLEYECFGEIETVKASDIIYTYKDGDIIKGFLKMRIYLNEYNMTRQKRENVLWINLISVVPDYRRQGIGTKLLNFAINYDTSESTANNIEVIGLQVNVDNEPAIKLYEKAGFIHQGWGIMELFLPER